MYEWQRAERFPGGEGEREAVRAEARQIIVAAEKAFPPKGA